MRILITGGAGFIGAEAVAAARRRGFTVTVLDSLRPDVHGARSEGARPDGEQSHRPHPDGAAADRSGVRFVAGDVTDPTDVASALADVDVVAHLAAKVGLGTRFGEAPDYVASNDLGTAVLLAGMAEAGVRRLVLASSMVVYGEGRYTSSRGPIGSPPRRLEDLEAGRFDPLDPVTGAPLTPELVSEDAPLDPRNVYAATKVAQEHLTRAWARAEGGSAALLRFHNVYGPGMPQHTPYAGVAAIFRSMLALGEAPRVFEDGGQRRDFVHVRDVAEAVAAAAQWTADREPGDVRAFNVGSGTPHTVGEFAAALSAAVGGPPPVVTGEYRLGDVRHITASSERLHAELDVPAPVPFDEGVAAFATAPMRAEAAG